MDKASEEIKLPPKKDPTQLPPETRLTLEYLKKNTHDFLDAFNKRDFDALTNQWSNLVDHNRFTGTISNHAPALSWAEHIDVYRHMAHAEPNLQINPLQIDFDIDIDKGTAELYIFAEATGHSGGIRTQGLSVLSWRQQRGGGQWLCIKHTIFSGTGALVGHLDF